MFEEDLRMKISAHISTSSLHAKDVEDADLIAFQADVVKGTYDFEDEEPPRPSSASSSSVAQPPAKKIRIGMDKETTCNCEHPSSCLNTLST